MSEQMEKNFEYAVRNKLRISFKGQLGVEDLWDLSTTDLNTLYSNLRRMQKNTEEESLISPVKVNKDLDVSIELVKYIFQVKMDEQNVRRLKKQADEKRKRIRQIIAEKEDNQLASASIEELQKMLDAEEVEG